MAVTRSCRCQILVTLPTGSALPKGQAIIAATKQQQQQQQLQRMAGNDLRTTRKIGVVGRRRWRTRSYKSRRHMKLCPSVDRSPTGSSAALISASASELTLSALNLSSQAPRPRQHYDADPQDETFGQFVTLDD